MCEVPQVIICLTRNDGNNNSIVLVLVTSHHYNGTRQTMIGTPHMYSNVCTMDCWHHWNSSSRQMLLFRYSKCTQPHPMLIIIIIIQNYKNYYKNKLSCINHHRHQ